MSKLFEECLQLLAETGGVFEVDAVYSEGPGAQNVCLVVIDEDALFRLQAVTLQQYFVDFRIGFQHLFFSGDDNPFEKIEKREELPGDINGFGRPVCQSQQSVTPVLQLFEVFDSLIDGPLEHFRPLNSVKAYGLFVFRMQKLQFLDCLLESLSLIHLGIPLGSTDMSEKILHFLIVLEIIPVKIALVPVYQDSSEIENNVHGNKFIDNFLSLAIEIKLKPKNMSKVYMTREISPESLVKMYEVLGVPVHGKVAVKISSGEPGGNNYLKPELISKLVDKVQGTIVECNTAYPGPRGTAETHLQVMADHGFSAIAPVEILDAEGEIKIPVRDDAYLKYDIVGAGLSKYDSMVNLAHFKGHTMGGFGGVLKNQSIGIASANGKCYQHSTGQAETLDKFNEMLMETVTEEGAGYEAADWVAITHSHDIFHECMANCAAAVEDYMGKGNVVYINVMNNLSIDCDCSSCPPDPEMHDIGILSSLDPVALDQACVDLVFHHHDTEGDSAEALRERISSRNGVHTIEHAEKIGLGSREYEMVEL